MTVSDQNKIEVLIKRLEADKLIYRFCEYADISYDTYYRVKQGNSGVKIKTIRKIIFCYKAFDKDLKKEAKNIETLIATPKSVNFNSKQDFEARQDALKLELAQYMAINKAEIREFQLTKHILNKKLKSL